MGIWPVDSRERSRSCRRVSARSKRKRTLARLRRYREAQSSRVARRAQRKPTRAGHPSRLSDRSLGRCPVANWCQRRTVSGERRGDHGRFWPNRDRAMGRSVQTGASACPRRLDPPASSGVASRLPQQGEGFNAQSGCHDRGVLGRLPGRTRRRVGGAAAGNPDGRRVRCELRGEARVSNVSATTQRVSCYTPEVAVPRRLDRARRLSGRRQHALPAGASTTGENLGPVRTRRTLGAQPRACSSRTTPSPTSASTRPTRTI